MDVAAKPPLVSGTSSSGTNPANRAGKLAHIARSGAKLVELPRPSFSVSDLLAAFGRGLEKLRRSIGKGIGNRLRRPPKLLFVSQTAALGERRSVAVVQFERQRFLVGCGPSSVALLARLPDADADPAPSSITSADPRTPGGNE